MKNILLLINLIVIIGYSSAQDIITKKDGTKIEAKVLEVSSTYVNFYRFDQLEGPLRTLETYEIQEIQYANGKIEYFKVANPTSTDVTKKPETNTLNPTAKTSKTDMMDAGIAFDFFVGGTRFVNEESYYFDQNGNYIFTPTKFSKDSPNYGFRISNKFYFNALPKWRTGIQVSYMRINIMTNANSNRILYAAVSPLNFGTANIIKINDKLGIEANLLFGLTISGIDIIDWDYWGMTWNPEVKLRYKVFALGLDYSRTSDISNSRYHRMQQVCLSFGVKF